MGGKHSVNKHTATGTVSFPGSVDLAYLFPKQLRSIHAFLVGSNLVPGLFSIMINFSAEELMRCV